MPYIQLLIFLSVLGGGLVTATHVGWPQEDRAVHYCGRHLARALALLCDDVPLDKRVGSNYLSNALTPPYYEDGDYEVSWPWLGKQHARTLTSGSRGKRQFVVNECCDKACTLGELMSYCSR